MDDRDVCRQSAWPDRAIGTIAESQQSLVTRRQLYALNLSRALIDNSVERSRLVPRRRGVCSVGHAPLAPFAKQMAAVLAVGEQAVLSHHSAAEMWELTPWRKPPAEVDVTVVGRDAGRRPGIRGHRAARMHEREITTLHGVPLTSAARTLRDSTDTRSDNEERLLRLIRAGHLPEPEFNARVGRYTVDALWRPQKLVLEVDSYDYHGTRWSFESDRERDLELAAAGFAVMRITADQLEKQPALVLVRLTQRLAALGDQSLSSRRSVS